MLTVAAEVGADDSPDAVTDGGGGADMRRALTRPIGAAISQPTRVV
jgi:hypothetical protein